MVEQRPLWYLVALIRDLVNSVSSLDGHKIAICCGVLVVVAVLGAESLVPCLTKTGSKRLQRRCTIWSHAARQHYSKVILQQQSVEVGYVLWFIVFSTCSANMTSGLWPAKSDAARTAVGCHGSPQPAEPCRGRRTRALLVGRARRAAAGPWTDRPAKPVPFGRLDESASPRGSQQQAAAAAKERKSEVALCRKHLKSFGIFAPHERRVYRFHYWLGEARCKKKVLLFYS